MNQDNHICHISVLNPLFHSRIYYKQAESTSSAGFFTTIIAQGKEPVKHPLPNLRLIPIGEFKRTSLRRLWAGIKILRLAKRQKATVYQIHSPEILWVGFFLKWLVPGCKILYDMHEDYLLNIHYGSHYNGVFKFLGRAYIRLIYTVSSKMLDGIIFAERCFRFPNSRQIPEVYIENKFKDDSARKRVNIQTGKGLNLVFTGTISESWGIDKALDFWKKANETQPTNFWIAGFSQRKAYIDSIVHRVRSWGLEDKFQLFGGNTYLEYAKIKFLIEKADVGLAFYQPLINLRDRIPTKFYEYRALGTPLIYTDHPNWRKVDDQFQIGIPFNPTQTEEILKSVRDWKPAPIPQQVLWQGEKKKLITFLRKVTKTDQTIS